MTDWQWQVVMALVRYVLATEGALAMPGTQAENIQIGMDDKARLLEAVRRDVEERNKNAKSN